MNRLHHWLCSSARWKEVVQHYALPWALEDIELGHEVLEIGPGYGVATELLRDRVQHLTCVESDLNLTEKLRRKFQGGLTIRHGDGTATCFPGNSFDATVCFTMLHHVRSAALQDKLFVEVARILKPGGIFAGTDSLKGRFMQLTHLFDTLVIVDPETLPQRLTAAGFEDVHVDLNPYAFRFRARKPPVMVSVHST